MCNVLARECFTRNCSRSAGDSGGESRQIPIFQLESWSLRVESTGNGLAPGSLLRLGQIFHVDAEEVGTRAVVPVWVVEMKQLKPLKPRPSLVPRQFHWSPV